MTEEQIKFLCKQLVENSNRPLSDFDKELVKQAIDKVIPPSIEGCVQNSAHALAMFSQYSSIAVILLSIILPPYLLSFVQ